MIAPSAGRADRRASVPGPLHGQAEPGDVVVVVVGPRAEVAQPDGAGDARRSCRRAPDAGRAAGRRRGSRAGAPATSSATATAARAAAAASGSARSASRARSRRGGAGAGGRPHARPPRRGRPSRRPARPGRPARSGRAERARTPASARRTRRSLHHVAPLRARVSGTRPARREALTDPQDPCETDSVASPSRRARSGHACCVARRRVTTRWTGPRAPDPRVHRRSRRPPPRSPNGWIRTARSTPSVAAAARAASVRPGPSWPNSSMHSRGSTAVSRRAAPGVLSTATTTSPCAAAKAARPSTSAWWCTATYRSVTIAPRRFQRRRPTMCTPAARERVGGAHHRADVVVVAEVLDGDVERVGAPARGRRRRRRGASSGRRRRRCAGRRARAARGRSARRTATRPATARPRRPRARPTRSAPGRARLRCRSTRR